MFTTRVLEGMVYEHRQPQKEIHASRGSKITGIKKTMTWD